MAFNLATFKTRALTAVIFVMVMLTGLLWNYWSFLVLFIIIHFGCWWEYIKLAEKIYSTKINNVIKWFFAICGFTLMLVIGLNNTWVDFSVSLFSFKISLKLLTWILEMVCLFIFITQNKQIPAKAKQMCFAGFIYISLSWGLMINLYSKYDSQSSFIKIPGYIIPMIIIASIWVNDTMAYLVGSFIGKTPLSKISPKKTWEGTIGGVVLAIFTVSFLAKWVFGSSLLQSGIIAAIASIFGAIGDLLESKLKRMAGVKDSGSLMPGHGGFLDRFDSLLLAVPFVWLYVTLVME
ncbi:MAG: phosphatidate cytidylyltransferase [Sphingobacteriales bacterium]